MISTKMVVKTVCILIQETAAVVWYPIPFSNGNFSTVENVCWRLFFLYLSLEHELEGEPAQEEHQLGQGDQRESAEHGQPATDCT